MILSKIAFRNAIKNWRKSLAAIISISAGFVSYVVFQGYVKDIDSLNITNFSNRSMAADVIVENPDIHSVEGKSNVEKFYIPKDHQQKIEEFLSTHDNVKTRVRFLFTQGMLSNGSNSSIFIAQGFDVDEGARVRGDLWSWNVIYGQPLQLNENPQSAILGQGLGVLMGCLPVTRYSHFTQNTGYSAEVRPFTCDNEYLQLSATTASGQLNAIELQVSGLLDIGFKDLDEKHISTSIENIQMLLDTDKIQYYSIQLNDKESELKFVDDFNNFAKQKQWPYRADLWSKNPIGEIYNQIKSLLGVFQGFIVTVIVLISGLSVLNTMLKAVKERTREVGTLRSIGFTGKQMSLIFSLEAFYLSLVGIIVGGVFSVGFSFIINNVDIRYKAGFLSEPVLFKISIDAEAYFVCAVLLTTLSVITSYLTSMSLSRTTVADNLTHV